MEKVLYKIRIRKGDTVIVRAGKYKGKTGKVLEVHPKLNKVTVEGINVVKRHRKPSRSHPQGGVSEITKPLWVSKVGIYDSEAKKASRVGFKAVDKGSKTRFLKTSGKEVK
jgi:large subunit ribosomal protein L24